jgi:uncharacterized membrane protein
MLLLRRKTAKQFKYFSLLAGHRQRQLRVPYFGAVFCIAIHNNSLWEGFTAQNLCLAALMVNSTSHLNPFIT